MPIRRVGLHGAGHIPGSSGGTPQNPKYYYVAFDGTGDYVNCGQDASLADLHAAMPFTIDLWVRIPDEQIEADGVIISKYNTIPE